MTKLPENIQRQANRIAEIAGKKVLKADRWDGGISYDADNDDFAFDVINEAERFLKEQGYAIGSMCRDEPMAFAKADKVSYIAKWRNIDENEYPMMDGVLLCDERGFRNPKEVFAVYFG